MRRHTHHDRYFARHLSSDGKILVYNYGADIFRLSPDSAGPERIDIRCEGPSKAHPRAVPVSPFLEDFDFSFAKNELAAVARGRGLLTSRQGDMREWGRTAFSRLRKVRWADGGQKLVGVNSTGLRETLMVSDLNWEKVSEVPTEDFGRAVGIQPSPDGRWVALSNDRYEMWLIGLESGTSRVIERSPFGEITGFDWSPDSSYLAYSCPLSAESSVIRLFHLATGGSQNVTGARSRFHNPEAGGHVSDEPISANRCND